MYKRQVLTLLGFADTYAAVAIIMLNLLISPGIKVNPKILIHLVAPLTVLPAPAITINKRKKLMPSIGIELSLIHI